MQIETIKATLDVLNTAVTLGAAGWIIWNFRALGRQYKAQQAYNEVTDQILVGISGRAVTNERQVKTLTEACTEHEAYLSVLTDRIDTLGMLVTRVEGLEAQKLELVPKAPVKKLPAVKVVAKARAR